MGKAKKEKQVKRRNPEERCYATNLTPGLELHRLLEIKFWKVKRDMYVDSNQILL